MRTLANISRADPQNSPLNLAASKKFDRRGALLRIAKRIANILDTAGDSDPARQMGRGMRTRLTIAETLASLLHAAFQHQQRADSLWQGIVCGFKTAFTIDIQATQ